MHNRVEENLPRTNNFVEGWHHRFQSNIGAYHPNFWKFVDILKREQGLNDLEINQMIGGQAPQPLRRKYQEATLRLLRVFRQRENRHILDYLRGIAHNIRL